jgi:Zn-dependent protease with chaperone function
MHLDYMVVALLCSFIAADPMPTVSLVLLGLILNAFFIYRTNKKLASLDVAAKVNPIGKTSFIDRVIFKEVATPDAFNCAKTFLWGNFIILQESVLQKRSSYIRSIIAHEYAHVLCKDTITTFIYKQCAGSLRFVVFLMPGIFIFLLWNRGVSVADAAPPALTLLVYYGPAAYLSVTYRNYLHRRELMADAEAAHIVGDDYRDFLLPAARREPFIKKKRDRSETHPTFTERWQSLSGEKRASLKSFFELSVVSAATTAFAMFGLVLNFIYDPLGKHITTFNLWKVTFAVTVFSVWMLNFQSILRLLVTVRPNGLSLRDRLTGLAGIALGALLIIPFAYLYLGGAYVRDGQFIRYDTLAIIAILVAFVFLFIAAFSILQYISSIFHEKGWLSHFLPIIIFCCVTYNYSSYYPNTFIAGSNTIYMAAFSVSAIAMFFIYAIILEIAISALVFAIRRLRSTRIQSTLS